MIFNLPLFIVLAAGSVQSIFMGCCLLGLRQKNIRELLLAALLFASGIRLLKSVLFIYSDQVSLYVINIGFAAHAATPVFLWFYVCSLGSSPLSRKHLLHLLPTILIIVFSGGMTLSFWYGGAYHVLIYYSVVYYGLSVVKLFPSLKKLSNKSTFRGNYHWIISLFLAVGVFIAGYFVNYNLRFISYEIAPLPYAVVVFPLGYTLWKHYHQINAKPGPMYGNAKLSSEQMTLLTEQLNKVLELQKPYLDPRLTVMGLSKMLNIPPYILSQVLNVHLNCGFSSLINSRRLQHACRVLENEENASLTIASIAYEAGFNSLSVFNKVFKESKGTTPNQFRKNAIPD
jgi:AraC-like DNA-binding protein